MKKYIPIILSIICILSLAGCGGDISDVKILEYQSEIYTNEDIEDAIEITKKYFKKEFSGCMLTEITYAGDEKSVDYAEWAERNNADEVIVLISSFDVDSSGGDGSLNPNSTYSNWNWILVRSNGDKWQHVDHGY